MSPSAPGGPAEPRPARPRDSAATRRALLEAARELFVSEGYDGTTVRAVADRAGVNQALLFRHFGNKEALFTEAMVGRAKDVLEAGPDEELLERTLTSMLTDETRGTELFFATLRSAGNPEIAATARDELGRRYQRVFASLATPGPGDGPDDAELRADLLLAWLLGIGLLRTVLRSQPLADADSGAVSAHVVRAAQALLTGR
jgi:AcrR family transcriptional regulator